MTRSPRGRPGEAGFSVIEVVIALAIVALIVAAIPPTVRLGKRAWEMSEALEQRAGIPVALRLIEQRLAEARLVSLRGPAGETIDAFRGAADQVSFVALEPPGERGGLYLYQLQGAPAGLTVSAAPIGADGPAQPVTTTLTPGPATLTLRYFGAATRGDRAQWQAMWASQTALPDLVELRLSVGVGTTRTVLITVVEPKVGRSP